MKEYGENSMNRDISIDILRGISIFTMVAANIGAMILAEPHPIWFRFYGTFAAPLFILLAGMMVVFTQQRKDYGIKYYLSRGAMVIAVGAVVDVFIMKIYPFMGVDVLYLIGISLPVAYLASRLKRSYQWVAIIAILIATPLLQMTYGYSLYPIEITLSGKFRGDQNQYNILYQWLIDGWFPIFPWLAFSLVGVVIASIRWRDKRVYLFQTPYYLFLALSFLLIGTVIIYFFPVGTHIRDGFSELFYPPTTGYIFLAIGVILTLFYFVDTNPSSQMYQPFQLLGESALFMYIFHLALREYFISKIWDHNLTVKEFIFVYLTLMTLLILISYGLRGLKKKWLEKPYIIRFILGG